MSADRAPLAALEWLRVTHADTLSGRRIEEAIAAERAAERERVLAPVRALHRAIDPEGYPEYDAARRHRGRAAVNPDHAHRWVQSHDRGPICSVCGKVKPEEQR